MTTITAAPEQIRSQARLRAGTALMSFGALAFVGYAVIFFILNFTDRFLELGIGREQVDVGKDRIEAFSPSLYHYVSHLHIAVSGFIAATGVAVFCLCWFGVRRGLLWAWVGAVAAPVLGLGRRASRALPVGTRHGRAPRADLPRHRDLRRRRVARAEAAPRQARRLVERLAAAADTRAHGYNPSAGTAPSSRRHSEPEGLRA